MDASKDAVRNRLIAVIAVVAVAFALRQTFSVTMPLAVAVVVIAALWPVKAWLDRYLPTWASYAGAILLMLLIFVVFVAAVYFSAAQVVQAFGENSEQFQRMYRSATQWAESMGVSLGGDQGFNRLLQFGRAFLANAYYVLVYLGFVALLVILGLPEVPALREKLRAAFGPDGRREVVDAADATASRIRQYLGVMTITSAISGVASAAFAFALGLDLAVVWGVVNFLFNYIPVIGNFAGIVPPALYAIVQFQNWTMPLAVFAGFGAIQIVISNFIYPMLQGRSLSLSPIVVVVALAFWSWVWGIPGALIAIPLTSALAEICQHFDSVRWISTLLSNGPEETSADDEAHPTSGRGLPWREAP